MMNKSTTAPTSVMGRALMTLATVLYGAMPIIVDLTESHVFHPDWTPHARFHMVWLLGSVLSVAVLALYCIWSGGPYRALKVRIGGILGLCVFGGFFLSAATMRLYGGALADVGGVAPVMGLDANLLGFSAELIVLLVGMYLARPVRLDILEQK